MTIVSADAREAVSRNCGSPKFTPRPSTATRRLPDHRHMKSLDTTLLPVERPLFESASVFVGRFSCEPRHALFKDSGEARNHLVVFPHTTVAIEHEGSEPFVSTTQNVTLYNRGQRYRRRAVVPGMGDRADFFAVRPDLLVPMVGDIDPERPFRRKASIISPALFLAERTLIADCLGDRHEPAGLEERIIHLIAAALARPARAEALPRASRERAELAKALLASDLERSLSIEQIARQAQTSVYHLCTLFRRHTGTTMHQFRLRLRLNHACDLLRGKGDILQTALDTGFSSHSHFTYASRRQFGVAPSRLR
jgi:AraC family transcriptional regulator